MPTNFWKILLNFWDEHKLLFCLILPPLVIILPGITQYPFPSSSQHSDVAISHFPNAYFLAEALSHWKEIPLWSPTILCGYPFAANPLSGIWYLPNWLAVILPLPFGINLLVIAHLIWGGIGVFRLLKGEGLSDVAALFGGLAFELMPKLLAHYGAGHISLIMTVSWTPWLIVNAQRITGQKSGSSIVNHSLVKNVCFSAFGLSSILLADIRWIMFAGLLWVSYLAMLWLTRNSRMEITGNGNLKNRIHDMRNLMGIIIISIGIALGLTAPFLLPFLEYVRLSTRSLLTAADNLIFSLPPAKMMGLIFPPFGDYYEWIVYPGIMVSILTGVCWTIKNHSKYEIFWSVVFIITLVFALGSYLPGSSWIAGIPGISLTRVPSRILFISGMALACLAARGLDEIIRVSRKHVLKTTKLVLVAMVGFLILLNIGAAIITGKLVNNFIWSLIFGSLSGLCIWMIIHQKQPVMWVIIILGISMIDWIMVDRTLFTSRTSQDVFTTGKEIVNYLSGDNDVFRVYSPSYSLPQQVAVVNNIELADGIDPLQFKNYVDYMALASGIEQQGYSVTLPPYKTGDPGADNENAKPNAKLLGLLNVKYIVSEYDIDGDGLELIAQFDRSRLYLNTFWLPRAWLQSVDGPIGENVSAVEELSWSPNRIHISIEQSDKTQLLVLSELDYPGWRVYVDDQEREIMPVRDLLRGVEILPGDTIIKFEFNPSSLLWGIFIFFMTIMFITGNYIYHGYRNRYT